MYFQKKSILKTHQLKYSQTPPDSQEKKYNKISYKLKYSKNK